MKRLTRSAQSSGMSGRYSVFIQLLPEGEKEWIPCLRYRGEIEVTANENAFAKAAALYRTKWPVLQGPNHAN